MAQTVIIPDNYKPTWKCEIGNKVYEYPSGTSQSVPDEVAAVIKNIDDMDPKEGSGGSSGGSGSGVFMVKFTYNTSDDSYTCDKTYDEILQAILDEKPVLCFLDNVQMKCYSNNLFYMEDTMICFNLIVGVIVDTHIDCELFVINMFPNGDINTNETGIITEQI